MCRKLANTRLSRVVSRDYVRHLADFPSFLEIQSAWPIIVKLEVTKENWVLYHQTLSL